MVHREERKGVTDDNLAAGKDISQMLAALIRASNVPALYLLYLQNGIKRRKL